MKNSESNSLFRALAGSGTSGDHLDADLLTAFAEGSLLEREREAAMAHLASCAECRAVLALCAVQEHQPARDLELVAAAAPSITQHKAQPAMRAWLPWVAAAACILIAAVVALRYEQQKPVPASPQSEVAQVNGPAAVSAPAPPPQAKRESSLKNEAAPPPQAKKTARPDALTPSAQSDALQLGSSASQQTQPQAVNDSIAAQQTAQQQQAKAIDSQQAEKSAQMTNERQSATARAAAPAFAGSMNRATVAGPVARPHWRINDDGHPERSFGQGAWTPVLTDEKARMHVVSVASGTVWVGGENDRVYRSADQGSSWQLVPLPNKGGGGHVIVHIRFDNAQTGTIEASDGTSWTTADGGTTWN